MNLFTKWIYKPAKWYQFWLPQSGDFGGIIIGTIVGFIFVYICFFGVS